MEYVQNMQEWNQSRISKDMPCTRACQERTATCKFDGTCEKWQNYHAVKLERIEQYHHEKAKKRSLQPINGGRR